MSLSFTISAGARQRSRSQIRVPRDSWPHFIFETPPSWRARSTYLHPPGTWWPVIHRTLGSIFVASDDSQGGGGVIRPRLNTDSDLLVYSLGTDRIENIASNNYSIACVWVSVTAEVCLASCSLAMTVYSVSIVLAFGGHVTWFWIRE
jgi:hypothetical protein